MSGERFEGVVAVTGPTLLLFDLGGGVQPSRFCPIFWRLGAACEVSRRFFVPIGVPAASIASVAALMGESDVYQQKISE